MGGPASPSHSAGPAGDLLVLGNLSLNLGNFHVAIGDHLFTPTFKEFELLRMLAEQPNRVVPFDVLTRALWRSAEVKDTRRLHVLIYRLRSKIAGSVPYRLEIVRNRGYGLIESSNRQA